jgi:hypothetical protein
VQVRYYTRLIEENESWELVEVYADEGLTGVSTDKRMILTDACRLPQGEDRPHHHKINQPLRPKHHGYHPCDPGA